MAVKKSGMGRGINNLIPGGEEPKVIEKVVEKIGELMVSINKIEPNPNQPRRRFDEDALNELAESIRLHGIIDPLIVRKKDDYYEIVGGERRWRASKLVGLEEVPVIVKDLTDRQVSEIALIDNLQRKDLNPIEEAKAYKQLIEEYGLTQDEVAERVSKSRPVIANALRLLKLDEKVQQMVIDEMISFSQARSIVALPTGEEQIRMAELAFDKQMNARDIDKAVRELVKPTEVKDNKPKTGEQLAAVYAQLEEQLKSALGTKVRIVPKNDNQGAIEIEYYSKEQMEEIIERLEE